MLAGMCASCSGEKQSPLSAQAQSRGLNAASAFKDIDHTDTLALQAGLVAAHAIRSEYLLAGDTLAANDFDRAFTQALTRQDPELAQAVLAQPAAKQQ